MHGCWPSKGAEVWRRNGVKSSWIVIPPLRTVSVLLTGGREGVFHRGTAKDPVAGIGADPAKGFA